MTIAFPTTAQALDLDRGIENWVLGAAGTAILAGWWIWAMVATLPLTLDASEMRVEPPGGALPLAWSEPATLTEVLVASGDHVTKGQVIAVRDHRSLQRERDLAEARLQQAIGEAARLDDELEALASADARAAEADLAGVDTAELTAAKSQLSLEMALSTAERSHALAANGLTSSSADEQARAEAELARNANDTAVSELLRAKLEVQTAAAQRRIAALTRKRRQDEAEIAVKVARLTLEGAESALRGTILVSPADGTIQVRGGMAPGAILRSGDAVATLSRDGAFEVWAKFEAPDAVVRLKPGQAAVLSPERAGGFAPVALRVLTVVPSTGGAGAEVKLAEVDPAAVLRVGLGGHVSIESGTATPIALLASVLGFEGGSAK